MHPILTNPRKLLWYLAAWMLTGLFIALLLVTADLAQWGSALLFALPVAFLYSFVASSAYYVCRSLPMANRRFLFALAAFGGSSLLAGFAWLAICQGWNQLAQGLSTDYAPVPVAQHVAVMLFAAGCGFYLLSILGHDVLIAFDNVRLAERRAAESRVLARDAELQVLRTQINPHFLFNSLNSISALTTMDGPAARSMTIELAQFFRQTLALSEKQVIPLADEVALCRSFLAIEKIRFGKKLGSDIDIADDAQAALIPPMILQPLVENAIKHGIRDLVDGGTVSIRAFARDGWLHLAVSNPVDIEPSTAAGNGTGLRNLQQRFASIYGGRARASWALADGQFTVEMALPLTYVAA
ncbi:sensor histidine kinase [Undibacterium sp. TJN25]|uniref:sensor histidine kinase n=1 Tax=Undibacterium sp. TJN25 TaxID=3413056 RepID=UPI003BEFAF1E